MSKELLKPEFFTMVEITEVELRILEGQAEGWNRVFDELKKLSPGFPLTQIGAGARCGVEAALMVLREMAANARPAGTA
jgi:hypothetical protein